MAHTELNLRERRTIEDMLNAKIPVSKIAAELGRHRSTVYRDIKRNGFVDEELPQLNGYYGYILNWVATFPLSYWKVRRTVYETYRAKSSGTTHN